MSGGLLGNENSSVFADVEFTIEEVNGRKTQVFCFGSLEKDATRIIFIPGNPGVLGFYRKFLTSLATSTETKYTYRVYAMSYPGHDVNGLSDDVKGSKDRLSLEEQIEHKITFIRDHVPEGGKLILIGHSLGCYMIMQMLRRNSLANIQLVKIGLICPVIACMAESPTGQWFGPFCTNHPLLGRALIQSASWLPRFFLRRVVSKKFEDIFGASDYMEDIVSTAINFVKEPPCVMNAIHIGIDALDVIKEMDVDTQMECIRILPKSTQSYLFIQLEHNMHSCYMQL
jgi:pimeloyl-ACP methyl ester carboxylesterase